MRAQKAEDQKKKKVATALLESLNALLEYLDLFSIIVCCHPLVTQLEIFMAA